MTAQLFFSGVLTMGYLVAALYFFRFWREARERLFGFFAFAFLLLAVQRILLVVLGPRDPLYLIRLSAFVVIVIAVWDRNRR